MCIGNIIFHCFGRNWIDEDEKYFWAFWTNSKKRILNGRTIFVWEWWKICYLQTTINLYKRSGFIKQTTIHFSNLFWRFSHQISRSLNPLMHMLAERRHLVWNNFVGNIFGPKERFCSTLRYLTWHFTPQLQSEAIKGHLSTLVELWDEQEPDVEIGSGLG